MGKLIVNVLKIMKYLDVRKVTGSDEVAEWILGEGTQRVPRIKHPTKGSLNEGETLEHWNKHVFHL